MKDLLSYTMMGLCAYFVVAVPIAIVIGRMIRRGGMEQVRTGWAQEDWAQMNWAQGELAPTASACMAFEGALPAHHAGAPLSASGWAATNGPARSPFAAGFRTRPANGRRRPARDDERAVPALNEARP